MSLNGGARGTSDTVMPTTRHGEDLRTEESPAQQQMVTEPTQHLWLNGIAAWVYDFEQAQLGYTSAYFWFWGPVPAV